MKYLLVIIAAALFFTGCTTQDKPVDDVYALAVKARPYLRLSVYITAQTLAGPLSTEAGRRESVSMLRANGVTKVYLEVYRSGLVVPKNTLVAASAFYRQNGFEVTGGIATFPGDNFGVTEKGKLGWFNFQNQKTQDDLRNVMEQVAPIFDTFIIDDFLCTSDTSLESTAAKGSRSWSQYRRDLLTGLSKTVFIDPAKKSNPNIKMIIKYPQWYDRFHLFGYDVAREPGLFDEVWVGTETRGQYTPRFGYVQPYEGFVNYRWLATLAGAKTGGAWFDHIDCDADDFIEQAYQSVLAGAKELVLFNYTNFAIDDPGHHLLRLEIENLVKLARAVASNPVVGVAGYKPPNSDAGGDLYILDFVGMMGIPLVPVSTYPEKANVVFLPTQAAADTAIAAKIEESLKNGGRIVVTSGFLATVRNGERLAALAGIRWPVQSAPVSSSKLIVNGQVETMKMPLDLEAKIQVGNATTLIAAQINGEEIPFLTSSSDGRFYVLNMHTFSEQDFDAAGEVLLSPKRLGFLQLPWAAANILRQPFLDPLKWRLDAPPRVVLQPLENKGFLIHNYNREEVEVHIVPPENKTVHNVITGETIPSGEQGITIKMPPRSRIWVE